MTIMASILLPFMHLKIAVRVANFVNPVKLRHVKSPNFFVRLIFGSQNSVTCSLAKFENLF